MRRRRLATRLGVTAAVLAAATTLSTVAATSAGAAGAPNPLSTGDPSDHAFAAGAYIIDAGATVSDVQTDATGLKPYGLLYALVQAEIPVNWIIKSDKAAISQVDGNAAADFTFDCDGSGVNYSSKNYRTGAFVIDAKYASAASSIIATWKGKGVVVDGPCSDATPILPVYGVLRYWPRAVAMYGPYERYQRRTNRRIPLVVLEPR